MDISSFGIASVAVITVICYLIGQAVKATGINNKWIPIIVGVSGGVLGVVGMLVMADFPATDILTAVAVGIVSGLASTGVNQIAKQLSN
jgi:ribonucleotide monophosphatase NagD (HAD superfamily)